MASNRLKAHIDLYHTSAGYQERIVLIPCVSEKREVRSKAKDLYTSTLFRLCLGYAERQDADRIYIVSAKYGLLRLNEEIDPYNVTLNTFSKPQIKEWAGRVLDQMIMDGVNFSKTHFILLTGEKYREFLIPAMKYYSIPMKGLSIGRQLQFLKESLKPSLRIL